MAYEMDSGGASPKKEKKSDEELLKEAREYLRDCISEEEPEREKMKDDLRFCTLDQWPQEIRNAREGNIKGGPRPCLTIDKSNQYITQVVNDVRQGRPGINVRPQDDEGDIETAKILKGIVRNIEDQSNADIAYGTAVESAARMGLGFFRIVTEYISSESRDQEIFIRPISNTFSVYLSKHHMPDGSDAEHGFVVESMPIEKFKATFPDAKFEAAEFDDLDTDIAGHWRTEETITVVEYYCLKRIAEKMVALTDGTTMTEAMYRKWPEDVAGERPEITDSWTGISKQLKWSKMTAIEVLEKRDLPGQHIPIVEVVGQYAWVDGRRVTWGLVRPAKDSLRMYNYWASTLTEKMALSPKTPFIGAVGQFEGLEERWRKANTANLAYLEYKPIDVNGNALPAPQRQGATPLEAAYMSYMPVIEHDVQASLGIFKAGVGESESQQSGRAILALQRESDTGTYHYGANLGISIRQAGRIIVDMIPHYYDTKRIVRILGEDGEPQTAILDPEQQQPMREVRNLDGSIQKIFNPNIGKYDVTITVGPSYNTKRMEAQATFVELAKGAADPASAAILRYLTVQNSDFSGADTAAKMLKAMLPPQAAQAISEGKPDPAQLMAKIEQMKGQMKEMQQENMELKSGAQVEMQKVGVEKEAKAATLETDRVVAAEELRLEREKAEAAAALAREESERKHALELRKLDLEREREIAKDPNFKDLAMLPQVMEGLETVATAIGKLADLQAQSVATQQALVRLATEAARPKTVTLGQVRRGPDGEISGASVIVQPAQTLQ